MIKIKKKDPTNPSIDTSPESLLDRKFILESRQNGYSKDTDPKFSLENSRILNMFDCYAPSIQNNNLY